MESRFGQLLFLLLYSFFCQCQMNEAVIFNKNHTGVSFSHHWLRVTAEDENGTYSTFEPTMETLTTMLKVISTKFSRILTSSVDADWKKPYIRNHTYYKVGIIGRTAEAAAYINRERRGLSLTVMIGIDTFDTRWFGDQSFPTQMQVALEAFQLAESIFPGTVEGLLLWDIGSLFDLYNAKALFKFLQILRENSCGLKIGLRTFCEISLKAFTLRKDSTEFLTLKRQILSSLDFIICLEGVYDYTNLPIKGGAAIFSEYQSRMLAQIRDIEGLDTNVKVMFQNDLLCWNHRVNSTKFHSILREYWALMDEFATRNNFSVWLYPAVRENNDCEGFWQLRRADQRNNVSGYVESIWTLPAVMETSTINDTIMTDTTPNGIIGSEYSAVEVPFTTPKYIYMDETLESFDFVEIEVNGKSRVESTSGNNSAPAIQENNTNAENSPIQAPHTLPKDTYANAETLESNTINVTDFEKFDSNDTQTKPTETYMNVETTKSNIIVEIAVTENNITGGTFRSNRTPVTPKNANVGENSPTKTPLTKLTETYMDEETTKSNIIVEIAVTENDITGVTLKSNNPTPIQKNANAGEKSTTEATQIFSTDTSTSVNTFESSSATESILKHNFMSNIEESGVQTLATEDPLTNSTDTNITVETSESDSDTTETTEVVTSSVLKYAAITAGAIVFVAVSAGFLYIVCTRRNNSNHQCLTSQEISDFKHGIMDVHGAVSEDSSYVNKEALKQPYDRFLEISKGKLEIQSNQPLGGGEFGCVFKALLQDESDNTVEVALKMAKPGSGAAAIKGILSEIKILSYLGHHPNIVSIVGAYTAEMYKGIVYIATELGPLGSLKSCLKICRETTKLQDISMVPLSDMLRWSYEIACGMEYLQEKGVIHADLATRNVLLSSESVAKITDFGLSRRLYEYTSYTKTSQEPLPWRWMAFESLKVMDFSSKSDVWSYGVTLWEIFSLGAQPYPGIGWTLDFVESLESGFRLTKPGYATLEIFEILEKCWILDRDLRPTFTELKNSIRQIQTDTIETLYTTLFTCCT